MKKIAVIDYGAGNLRSVMKSVEHVAPDATAFLCNDAKQLADATHIILPGVGAFRDCMQGLQTLPQMIESMQVAVARGVPFLGICVGMQLLATVGREYGDTQGLGWLPAEVTPIMPTDKALKIPHMGWNTLSLTTAHPLFEGIKTGDHAYFVHSYHLQPSDKGEWVVATTDYGQPLVAAIAKDNVMGTQFHPEKSQATGLQLLKNFVRM